jgi:O6-methylguanine-DNA--protein-cysteine methyltransferase
VSDAKPTKGTGLEKAVAKLDAAFESLPQEKRQALALAIYRCYPAMQQYLADVDDLFAGQQFQEAVWSVLFSLACILPRGKETTFEKLSKAFAERAPMLKRFIHAVTDACNRPPIALAPNGGPDGADAEATPKVLPAASP